MSARIISPTPTPPPSSGTVASETPAQRKSREKAATAEAQALADIVSVATSLVHPLSKGDLRATLPGSRADAARLALGVAVVEVPGPRGTSLLCLDGPKLDPKIAELLPELVRTSTPPAAKVTPIGSGTKGSKATELRDKILAFDGLHNASGLLAVIDGKSVTRARTPEFHALVRRRLGDPGLAPVTINAASDAVDLSKLPAYVPPSIADTFGAGEEWRALLQYRMGDDGPVLRGNAWNVATVLLNHADWRGARGPIIAYDLFKETVVTREPPRWQPEIRPENVEAGPWRDTDDALLHAWFQRAEGSDMGRDAIRAGLSIAAAKAEFHPVREWLGSLAWDGEPRLHKLLPAYFNTANTIYEQAVGATWMRQAVARIYEPGCQADYALVLEGPQGWRKSSGLLALVPRVGWFADSGVDVTNKDSYENLRGKWIYCLSELASMSKGDIERWKTYITSRQDSYRPSYGERSRDFLRQTVFCGDTNKARYLNDPTGARRWLPVKVLAMIDVDAIERDRDQLWAEAVTTYKAGEPRWLDEPRLAELAKQHQAERLEDDPWSSTIAAWLVAPTSPEREEDPYTKKTTTYYVPLDISAGLLIADVLWCALFMPKERHSGAPSTRVAAILTGLGWTSRRCEVKGLRAVHWFPPDEATRTGVGQDDGGQP